jgi:hypothetical protein
MSTATKSKVAILTLEEGKRYAAPSASIPGFAYEVICHSQQPGDISCNCRGYEYRRTCKHVDAVQSSHAMVTDAEFERKLRDLFS